MACDRWKSCLDIYLLLENREIRDVIDTIIGKAAPILSALITAPTGSRERDYQILRGAAFGIPFSLSRDFGDRK